MQRRHRCEPSPARVLARDLERFAVEEVRERERASAPAPVTRMPVMPADHQRARSSTRSTSITRSHAASAGRGTTISGAACADALESVRTPRPSGRPPRALVAGPEQRRTQALLAGTSESRRHAIGVGELALDAHPAARSVPSWLRETPCLDRGTSAEHAVCAAAERRQRAPSRHFGAIWMPPGDSDGARSARRDASGEAGKLVGGTPPGTRTRNLQIKSLML